AGAGLDLFAEAAAGLLQQRGAGGYQGVDRAALLGGGVVHGIQQGRQRRHQLAALGQQRGVAHHAVGKLLAELGDHPGGGAPRFRGGFHQGGDLGDGRRRVGMRLRTDVGGGGGQRRSHGLVPLGGVLAGTGPVLAQRGGHRRELRLPGGQALPVLLGQRG